MAALPRLGKQMTTSEKILEPPSGQNVSEDLLRWVPRIFIKLYSTWVRMTYPFAALGRKLSIHYTCSLLRSSASRIKLGSFIQIRKDSMVQVVGEGTPSTGSAIILEDNICIGVRCCVSARNFVHLGKDVMLAQSVLIADHPYAYGNEKAWEGVEGRAMGGRVKIGDGTWIGQKAAIVCSEGELVLGRNCVVAANSVVTRSFPANSVLFGNPARVVKQFDPVRKAWVLGAVGSTKAESAE